MTKSSSYQHRQHHKYGFTTLLFSLIILFAATMMTLTIAQTSIYEQRLSGNNYRSIEAYFKADAGLEYIIKWLSITTPLWHAGSISNTETLQSQLLMPELAPYKISIRLQRNLKSPEIVYIQSIVTHDNDPNWITQAQQTVEIKNNKIIKLAGTWRDF